MEESNEGPTWYEVAAMLAANGYISALYPFIESASKGRKRKQQQKLWNIDQMMMAIVLSLPIENTLGYLNMFVKFMLERQERQVLLTTLIHNLLYIKMDPMVEMILACVPGGVKRYYRFDKGRIVMYDINTFTFDFITSKSSLTDDRISHAVSAAHAAINKWKPDAEVSEYVPPRNALTEMEIITGILRNIMLSFRLNLIPVVINQMSPPKLAQLKGDIMKLNEPWAAWAAQMLTNLNV